MRVSIDIGSKEVVDELTLASAILYFCDDSSPFLDPVKVAKAILVEREDTANGNKNG